MNPEPTAPMHRASQTSPLLAGARLRRAGGPRRCGHLGLALTFLETSADHPPGRVVIAVTPCTRTSTRRPRPGATGRPPHQMLARLRAEQVDQPATKRRRTS